MRTKAVSYIRCVVAIILASTIHVGVVIATKNTTTVFVNLCKAHTMHNKLTKSFTDFHSEKFSNLNMYCIV